MEGSLGEAEEQIVPMFRELGQEVMHAHAHRVEARRRRDLLAAKSTDTVKKVHWLTNLGLIDILQQGWEVNGALVRPFCMQAVGSSGGGARRVQRPLTDFGAGETFASTAEKIIINHENHGVEVSVYRVGRTTYQTCRAYGGENPAPKRARPAKGSAVGLAEADGCMMLPATMQAAPPGADRRKHRKIEWTELRLLAERDEKLVRTHYAATMP